MTWTTPTKSLRAVGALLLRIPRGLGWLPVLAWAALIFYGSSKPAPEIVAVVPLPGVLENFGHALEYGVFAVCLSLCVPRRDGWVVLDPRTTSTLLGIVLVYAASDEWHQSFVPHRDATAYDVLTDVVGAAATLACIAALGRPRDAGRALAIRFVVGLAACFLAAGLATWEP